MVLQLSFASYQCPTPSLLLFHQGAHGQMNSGLVRHTSPKSQWITAAAHRPEAPPVYGHGVRVGLLLLRRIPGAQPRVVGAGHAKRLWPPTEVVLVESSILGLLRKT